MKIYIIAGEPSGDLHASNLVKALIEQSNKLQIRAFGGQRTLEAGAELFMHYREMAFMGFWEVFKNIFKIKKIMGAVQKDLIKFQPDVLVLVDFAGFNLRMAKFAKKNNIKVAYYISPKIWAWNQKRAYKIKKLVDEMYVILPFEVEFYKKFGINAQYVGNPLFDAIRDFKPNDNFIEEYKLNKNTPIIALLPGSRSQEVKKMLPLITELPSLFPDFQFVVASVHDLPISLYHDALKHPNIKVIEDCTYDLLNHAKSAVVTSGTATLETALWEVPQVVVYKTSQLSYLIAKRLIKVDFISLVNLIAEKEVVKELIQSDYHIDKVKNELTQILSGDRRDAIIFEYKALKSNLGDHYTSKQLAKSIIEQFKK